MANQIRHTAYLNLVFDAVCQKLADDAGNILARATANASSHADHLVIHLDKELRFFRLDENVTITASALDRADNDVARMDLDWHADRRRRLLPNLDAELLIHPLIQTGPNATTALSIVGVFEPPSGIFRRIDEALFTRRIMDAVAQSFIASVARIVAGTADDRDGES